MRRFLRDMADRWRRMVRSEKEPATEESHEMVESHKMMQSETVNLSDAFGVGMSIALQPLTNEEFRLSSISSYDLHSNGTCHYCSPKDGTEKSTDNRSVPPNKENLRRINPWHTYPSIHHPSTPSTPWASSSNLQ